MDLHYFGKLDPDQSDKQDPDQSEKVEALKGHLSIGGRGSKYGKKV
jgi:hypothetical protein